MRRALAECARGSAAPARGGRAAEAVLRSWSRRVGESDGESGVGRVGDSGRSGVGRVSESEESGSRRVGSRESGIRESGVRESGSEESGSRKSQGVEESGSQSERVRESRSLVGMILRSRGDGSEAS